MKDHPKIVIKDKLDCEIMKGLEIRRSGEDFDKIEVIFDTLSQVSRLQIGVELIWGNSQAAQEIIKQVAKREGIGAIIKIPPNFKSRMMSFTKVRGKVDGKDAPSHF